MIAHELAIGTLTIASVQAQTLVQDILASLHEQRKVLQPVRQVQWVTSWQASGIGSKLKSSPLSCHPISCGWKRIGKWPASTQVFDNANESDESVMHYLLGACVQDCLP